MATEIRSRLSPNDQLPYSKLFENTAREAQQAEVILLRKLLMRAYGVLQDVVIEAREAGEPDALAESLMRDISAALDKHPTFL